MPPSNGWSNWPWRRHRTLRGVVDWLKEQRRPSVTFPKIRVVEAPPKNDSIGRHEFFRVVRKGQDKWALFHCPCGCAQVITLSLQRAHTPHWSVSSGKGGRPSMRPSVWRDVGCMSHFWIEDGRVYWCRNTGAFPQNFSS